MPHRIYQPENSMKLIMLSLSMSACAEKELDIDDSAEPSVETPNESFAFVGSWEDNYGMLLDITNSDITDNYGNIFAIEFFSNENHHVIAQNDSNNVFHPELWSRFEWTTSNDVLYYCHVTSDAVDAETASRASADPNNTVFGCSGTPWGVLRTQIDIMGSYTDNNDESHTINAFQWIAGTAMYYISSFSNEDGWLIAQNGAETNASEQWSRFEWTTSNDVLYYCHVIFNAIDAETASRATADPYDTAAGCSGNPWSILTRSE